MKRLIQVVCALTLALVPYLPLRAAGTLVPTALAGEAWCDDDPLVVIVTPAGNLVPVYNTMGVQGVLHAPDIAVAQVSYTTKSVNGGKATQVKLNVTIPNDVFGSGFPTRATISTGPMGTFGVLNSTTGTSGSPMSLQFTLNVP